MWEQNNIALCAAHVMPIYIDSGWILFLAFFFIVFHSNGVNLLSKKPKKNPTMLNITIKYENYCVHSSTTTNIGSPLMFCHVDVFDKEIKKYM